jgi:hypothetical protein
VGQIDEVHHTKGERHTNGHQKQDHAQLQTVEHLLNEEPQAHVQNNPCVLTSKGIF